MKSNLRLFVAVCGTGSLSRAADACNVSQPAVTQALGKRERLAGRSLFLRQPRGMFMTVARHGAVADSGDCMPGRS
ncbi:hypothetical protein RHIZO_00031 [Rhizobiaceae bacterium]|nr:hypothetical protein RHIZO_00031 [Rhizobiaceae bacterium]